jgi:hypothetical protein
MILAAGSAFAAQTPAGKANWRTTIRSAFVIDKDKTEAFWENLIEESEEDNDQLAADNSVPP